MKKLLALGLLLGCVAAQAATVYRCEDAGGRLTFSATGCALDSASSLQDADNARPGGAKPTLMAKPRAAARRTAPHAPTVVGTKADGCGDLLTASERRQAIIRGQVKAGMSRADVENALGQPRADFAAGYGHPLSLRRTQSAGARTTRHLRRERLRASTLTHAGPN
ncbi:hypothetical protein Q3H58_001327 [Pseudomonas psychrotolerans]|nr:hypothetical protein [Pseudomonas psychrotolerans]